MIHQRFDMAKFLLEVGSGPLPDGYWNVGMIAAREGREVPSEFASRWRKETEGRERVPADVVVWVRGEASRRDLTKVGGVPYWPTSRPWPHDDAGRPMRFVAQFNFTDSRDLVGELPGDLLIVHARCDPDEGIQYWVTNTTWISSSEETLIAVEEIAEDDCDPFIPCYARLWRTFDCLVPPHERTRDVFDHATGDLYETKMGGLPVWAQGPERNPGRFIAMLSSNLIRRTPGGTSVTGSLQIGDMGAMLFFLRDDGTVNVAVEY